MTRHHRSACSERGTGSLVVIFTILIIAALTLSLLEHGVAEVRSVKTFEQGLAAFELAELALSRAEMELLGQLDHDNNGIGNVAGTLPGGGTYEVVANQVPGTNRWVLSAVGQKGHGTRRLEISIKVSTPFVFHHALFSAQDLNLDSSVQTDSFDSRVGTYASQLTASDALGWYAEATGHIGSNADIDIWSDVTVRGDARCGVASSTELHGVGCDVYGDEAPRATALDVPAPLLADFEDALACNNNAEIVTGGDVSWDPAMMNLRLEGNATLTLSGGTYFFADFVMAGSSRLIVSSETQIYVTRNLALSNAARVNDTGSASDLRFIAHPYNLTLGWLPPSDPIVLNSTMSGAFTLYAPGRDIYNTTSFTLYGALVGREINLVSSIVIHYDRALGDVEGSGVVIESLYWRDLSPPTRN